MINMINKLIKKVEFQITFGEIYFHSKNNVLTNIEDLALKI